MYLSLWKRTMRQPSPKIGMTPGTVQWIMTQKMMSLDLSGDLGVVINLGFMDSKLFKINKV